MIDQDQVIPLILNACPSFQHALEKSQTPELLYTVMGDLASHLLSHYQAKQTDEFKPLCEVIERLHVEGDRAVRELAPIGLLEGIQNVWSHSSVDPNEFCQFLLPESLKWWRELSEFWAGRIPYVGASLSPRVEP